MEEDVEGGEVIVAGWMSLSVDVKSTRVEQGIDTRIQNRAVQTAQHANIAHNTDTGMQ